MIFSAQTEKLGKAGAATIDKSISDKEGILSQGTKKASLLVSKQESLVSSEGAKTLGETKTIGGIKQDADRNIPRIEEERGERAETPPEFMESENINEHEL